MLVSSIIDRIKFEAKLNASNQYDSWILGSVNQELKLLYSRYNYQENLTDATLSLTDGVAYVALPSDFARLANPRRIKFYTDGSAESYSVLTLASPLTSRLIDGSPSYFQIKQNRLYVFPYSLALSTHRIEISYYKKAAEVSLISDIQDDWASIVEAKLIGRLMAIKDSKMFAKYDRDAKDRFIDTV